MNFLFACGGTAGHINPALAVASELDRLSVDAKFLFIGAGRDMEKRLIPKAGYDLENIRMSGLKRGFSPDDLIHNLKTMRNLATAGNEAAKIIKRFKPDAAIGTGGYICYPVLRKAAQLRIPTIVHEANAVPGLTTKLLSAIADEVLISFRGLEKYYRKPERVIFIGTPVRYGFETCSGDDEIPENRGKPLVLSFWGSLGAERMNDSIAEFIKANIESGEFDHIHAMGRMCGLSDMKDRLKRIGVRDELPPGIEIRDYIDDMQTIMAKADIVLCRAGGSTVAELTAMGKPSVLIPSPYVSNNEQEKNAEQLEMAGGAVVIRERDCNGEVLYRTVTEILADKERLKNMSESQKSLGNPKAAEEIAKLVLSLVNKQL